MEFSKKMNYDSFEMQFFKKVTSSLSNCTLILLLTPLLLVAFFPQDTLGQNPIVTENLLTGTPKSVWDVNGSGDPDIQGFATEMSIEKNATIDFKISVASSNKNFTIDIYRLGYYQGNGARLIASLGTFTGIEQAIPEPDAEFNLVDCGNWTTTASWTVPNNAVSGVYIARLTRADDQGASHIVFVVRDDASTSKILFKTSDATWQAYNFFGGRSLYGTYNGNIILYNLNRGKKVSYNRPFKTRDIRPENFVFASEYAMIRWLERNGYDVSYSTDLDFDRNTTPIMPSNHSIILSVGHDEYWSLNERNRIENARNAGVHLAFFSGNEGYWKTRWDDNHRTLICYKEGKRGEYSCGFDCDPEPGTWTGLWRLGANKDAGRPENALTGQTSWLERSMPLTVSDTVKNLRFWRNTAVANLPSSTSLNLGTAILGYEWDFEQPALKEFYPKGRILMSSTILVGDGNGFTYQDEPEPGNFNTEVGKIYNHKLSLYRHSSGALVFGAGTINWSWGLDNVHDVSQPDVVPAIQQATVNLFADMGVQAGSLQGDLIPVTASTDNTAPVITMTSPTHNSNIGQAKAITITGQATDIGGVVAGVEVSLDGGLTWDIARIESILSNEINWSYTFQLSKVGNFEVRVRGFDDSGNMSISGAAPSSSSITLNGTCPCTLFPPLEAPGIEGTFQQGTGITLGTKFQSNIDGYITGVKFYKDASVEGLHIGKLWDASTGITLAVATFTSETSSGWQQVSFENPVQISANTTYIISVYSENGYYSRGAVDFTAGITRGPLRALTHFEEGPNAVYSDGNNFPENSSLGNNYLVDAVFNTVPSCTNGTIQSFGTVCAEQQINLRFAPVSGQAPYSLNLNGTLLNNIIPNTTFGSSIIAANISQVNVSIWPSSSIGFGISSNTSQREVGVKFRSTVQGVITAVRFYKTTEAGTGTFPVRLYDLTTGNLVNGFSIGSITITNEGVSGWQQATLNAPVPILPNRTYVATYVAQNGRYAESPSDLNLAKTNGPLTALADNTDGPNGIYKTGSGSGVPTESDNNGTNYWVDVVFSATNQIRLTEIIDNYGNSCFSNNPNIQTLELQTVSCLLLPVTFQEFSLSVRNNDINLFWSTASESNNKGFQIQRSLDGNNWINIGFVNGAGNSQTLKKYQYPDRGLKDGRYFYRLKQFDLNGDFKYSKVISAAITNKLSYVLGQNYPNPARQNTTISYSVPVKSPVEMSLYDMQGRQIKMLVNEIKESGTYTIDLDTRKLSKGVYHYKMKSGSYSDVKRLLVE